MNWFNKKKLIINVTIEPFQNVVKWMEIKKRYLNGDYKLADIAIVKDTPSLKEVKKFLKEYRQRGGELPVEALFYNSEWTIRL